MFRRDPVLLPPEHLVVKVLTRDDFYVIQYYGTTLLGRLYSWIFWKRYELIIEFLTARENDQKRLRVLDDGCGAMFLGYVLTKRLDVEYIGLDLLPARILKQYKKLIESCTHKSIGVVRASAEACPFRSNVFNYSFLLDVLEHLKKPRKAVKETGRAVQDDGFIIVSLPLEKVFTRLNRAASFIIHGWMPEVNKKDHYIGDVPSYDLMVKYIEQNHEKTASNYSPLGITEAINFSAVHFFRKKKLD